MTRLKRRQGIAADYDSSCRFFNIYFLVVFFILIGQAELTFSADQQTGSSDSSANNKDANLQEKASSTLQFMGLVDVGERQLVNLLPGEAVDTYYCKQGDFVKKGQPILTLNSDAITNSLADLIIKKNKVKEGIQQLQFAELEKRQKEKQLQRIEGKIDTEKSLKNQIAGYTSPVLQQLEMQRLALLEQLEVSSVHIVALKENNLDNEEMLKMIINQIDKLELRRQNLAVNAPFDARVFYLNPNQNRIPPGGMVCELRNETFSLARGKIIQHQRNLVKVGDTVRVALDFSADDSVEGSVQSIEYVQEHREMQGYSSFEVIIRIDAQAKWLRAGVMVSISRQGLPGKKN